MKELTEEQQKELELIKQRQQKRGERLMPVDDVVGGSGEKNLAVHGGSTGGPTPQQQQQAGALRAVPLAAAHCAYVQEEVRRRTALPTAPRPREARAARRDLEGAARCVRVDAGVPVGRHPVGASAGGLIEALTGCRVHAQADQVRLRLLLVQRAAAVRVDIHERRV